MRSAVSRALRNRSAYAANSSRRPDHPVVDVDALVAFLAQPLELGDPTVDLDIRELGRRGHTVEQVPVGGERLGDRTQLLEPHARREPEHDRGLVLRRIEHLVDEPFPTRIERDRGRDLVADLDARWEPGLDRELGEEALREGVQRADRGRVELVERTRDSRRRPDASRARPARGSAARPPPSR